MPSFTYPCTHSSFTRLHLHRANMKPPFYRLNQCFTSFIHIAALFNVLLSNVLACNCIQMESIHQLPHWWTAALTIEPQPRKISQCNKSKLIFSLFCYVFLIRRLSMLFLLDSFTKLFCSTATKTSPSLPLILQILLLRSPMSHKDMCVQYGSQHYGVKRHEV